MAQTLSTNGVRIAVPAKLLAALFTVVLVTSEETDPFKGPPVPFNGEPNFAAADPRAEKDKHLISKLHEYRRNVNTPIIDSHSEEHWADYDVDEDGKITWDEFQTHYQVPSLHGDNVLEVLPHAKIEFDETDSNGDGHISKVESCCMLTEGPGTHDTFRV